jgi:hypothetical protein
MIDDSTQRGKAAVMREAQPGTDSTTRLTVRIVADTVYTITLWYTFPRLEYVLRTAYADGA